jgi:hypothetical protein
LAFPALEGKVAHAGDAKRGRGCTGQARGEALLALAHFLIREKSVPRLAGSAQVIPYTIAARLVAGDAAGGIGVESIFACCAYLRVCLAALDAVGDIG